jgi:hypothetical protein
MDRAIMQDSSMLFRASVPGMNALGRICERNVGPSRVVLVDLVCSYKVRGCDLHGIVGRSER